MKIRNGFVSNSSSSSFLIVGVKKNKLSDEQIEKIGKKFREYYTDYNDEDSVIFGEGWSVDSDCYEVKDFAVTVFEDVAKNIKETLGENIDVRVFFGTRYN